MKVENAGSDEVRSEPERGRVASVEILGRARVA